MVLSAKGKYNENKTGEAGEDTKICMALRLIYWDDQNIIHSHLTQRMQL